MTNLMMENELFGGIQHTFNENTSEGFYQKHIFDCLKWRLQKHV